MPSTVPLRGGLGGAYSGGGGAGGFDVVVSLLGLTIRDWVQVVKSLRLNTSFAATADGSLFWYGGVAPSDSAPRGSDMVSGHSSLEDIVWLRAQLW